MEMKENETTMVNETPHDDSAKDVALQSHTGEDSTGGTAAVPGAEDVKRGSCRAVAVCMGLLCLLLLIGLIILALKSMKNNCERETETVFNNTYNNLTAERDRLQTHYENLMAERDQLQAYYNNLTAERDQLQERFETLTKDRSDLHKKLKDSEWVYFRGSFYHVSSDSKPWQQSRDDCLQQSADLAIINSREEQDFVNQFKKSMWMGLTDSETEGTWKWVDGTLVTTSYWGSREPNGATHENCGNTKYYEVGNSWNDEDCSMSFFWICEKQLFP